MGLDIYFNQIKRKGPKLFKDNNSIHKSLSDNIITELAYFRKVNFVVKFFCDAKGCSKDFINCADVIININDLKELKERCDKVLASKSLNIAQALLPTENGFFFGSSKYDEDYFEDVKDVSDSCAKMIQFCEENPKAIIAFHIWF